MGRADWDYIPIPHEMGSMIDNILKKEGRKYGLLDKNTFIRSLLGEFIACYEDTGRFDGARKGVIKDTVKKRQGNGVVINDPVPQEPYEQIIIAE